MKKTIALIVCIIIAIGCSRPTIKSDKENLNLKGDVQSTLVLSYEAIDKFGEGNITKGKLNSFGSEFVVFDSLGNELSSKEYYFKNIVKDFEYKYDTSGYTIELIGYEDDGKVSFINRYINDSLGNVLIETDDRNNKTIYTYDDKKRLVKEAAKYWDYLIKYDNNGNAVEKGFDWKDGRVSLTKLYYDINKNNIKSESDDQYSLQKFDKENRQIEMLVYIKNSQKDILKTKRKIAYDNKGNPIQFLLWNQEGKLDEVENFHYYYIDTAMTTEITMDENDVIKAILNKLFYVNNKLKSKIGYKIDAEVFNEQKSYYVQNLLTTRSYSSKYFNFQEVYTYDKNRLIEKKTIEGDSIIVTNYDRKSRPSLITEFDKNNKAISTTKFEYSGSSKNGTIKQYINDLKTKKETSLISSYKMGKLVEQKELTNGIEVKIRIEYNENGDIIKNENASINEVESYEYKYDKKGNWIEKTTFKNVTPTIIEERIIKYRDE